MTRTKLLHYFGFAGHVPHVPPPVDPPLDASTESRQSELANFMYRLQEAVVENRRIEW